MTKLTECTNTYMITFCLRETNLKYILWKGRRIRHINISMMNQYKIFVR